MVDKPTYYFFIAAAIPSNKEREDLKKIFDVSFPDTPEMIRKTFVCQQNGVSTFSYISSSVINWKAMMTFRDKIFNSVEAVMLELISNCPDFPPIEIKGWTPSNPKPSFIYSIIVLANFRWS